MASSVRPRFIAIATASYAVFAFAWIFVTDRLIAAFSDLGSASWFSTAKGFVFVLVTTAALYSVLRAVPPADTNGHAPAEVPPRSGVRWSAYALAVLLSVAVFALLRGLAAVDTFADHPILMMLVIPPAASALLGGRGPGLLATGLAGLAAWWLSPPIGSFTITRPIDQLQWFLLIGTSIFISFVAESLQRSRQQAMRQLDAQRRLEQELRENEERLRLALASANQGFYDHDVRTGRAVVSREYATMLGYDPDTFVETTDAWFGRMHPDDRPQVVEVFRAYLAGEIPEYRVEFRQRTASGAWKWILSLGSVVERDRAGKPVRMLGTHTDMTSRMAAEQEIRRLSQAIEHSPASVVITDRQGNIEYVNPKFTQVTGYTRDEVLGRNPRVLKSGETPAEEYRQLWDTITSGGTWQGEFHNRRKNGELYWEFAAISPIVDAQGTITHFVALKEDITDRKAAELALQQAQRMDAVGRLAGGVAHDFNNMLNVILGYADMMMARLPDDSPLREDLGEILNAARRSADLTGQLLAFARRQTIAPKVLDLNAVIGERVKMLRRLIGEDIAFTVVPGADLWPISIDPSQIDQVLANLSVNSRDAIDGVGHVSVETRNIHLDEAYCAEHPGFSAGDFVELSFSDTGRGMDRATQARVFEPFFTTKEPGKGTGLGLATVYGIVKQNGGFINVYSEVGQGTTFRLYLPRHIGETIADQSTAAATLVGGTETILLVEDEVQILRMCQRVLSDVGYTVLVAASPGAAITRALEHSGTIDLLLSDVIMPGMNGKELQARIEQMIPGIRTVFMSGYTADVVTHRGVLDQGVRLLQKPFSPRDLTRWVRDALDTR